MTIDFRKEGDDKSTPPFRHHVISVQKMVLYETKARFYLVGSNNTQTKFRVLKVDRTEPIELIVIDDKVEYTQKEIRDLILMINHGNRTKTNQKAGNGLVRTVSAFGIVGFVRFMEGYYIILITKRRRVAMIGHHAIYKIEDTSMIYIPNETARAPHPDEQRYMKMFQNVDLSSNFYFSYSYDLTHTLQYNMLGLQRVLEGTPEVKPVVECTHHATTGSTASASVQKGKLSVETAQDFFSALKNVQTEGDSYLPEEKSSSTAVVATPAYEECKDSIPLQEPNFVYAVRNSPQEKFVWNTFLVKAVEHLHSDWILHITHGFVGQSNVNVFGKALYLTLIARRSNKYSGTRFLKRGANFEGDVANEVETEQILFDASVSSLERGRFTSFVQLRGSIPAHWSQDVSKMVPKPPISFILSDPFAETAGEHFNQLLSRYGSPIILLNLVKKREKKRHESMLTEEFISSVTYLNQFLPPEHHIQYVSFDMARMNKLKEANVMARLGEIAEREVQKTGIFQSFPPHHRHHLRPQPYHRRLEEKHQHQLQSFPDHFSFCGRLQTGTVRVNCVDCLDRTNTAQFALGKCALGFQLCALGVAPPYCLQFDSDCVRMLEGLYEDHGDTLALQYGGSQLVHRIKTYRKTSPWTSQSNDIMQTLSRYYSNTFSDADKQNAINLFLGVFVPEENKTAIWELPSDYYLHHSRTMGVLKKKGSCTQWWDKGVMASLPFSYDEKKNPAMYVMCVPPSDETVDAYLDYYRPFEFSIMSELFAYKIPQSIKDFMPTSILDYSPFSVRILPGKRREELGRKGLARSKNPSVTGQSSVSSTASTSSSTDEEDSSPEEHRDNNDDRYSDGADTVGGSVTFENLFPSMWQTYGVEIRSPKKADIALYRRYATIAKTAGEPGWEKPLIPSSMASRQSVVKPLFEYSPENTSVSVRPPRVSATSLCVYVSYVKTGSLGASAPKGEDKALYQDYVSGHSWDRTAI